MMNTEMMLMVTLHAINKDWGTDYKVIDNNLYCYAKHICRIECLESVFLGNGEVILKFFDDDNLILTPRGYYFASERREMATI